MGHVALGKWLNFSEFSFPYVSYGNDKEVPESSMTNWDLFQECKENSRNASENQLYSSPY